MDKSPPLFQHVGVELLKDLSLMQTCVLLSLNISTMVSPVNMFLLGIIPYDPWIMPENSSIDTFDDYMSLSPIEKSCEVIHLVCSENFETHDLVNLVDNPSQYLGPVSQSNPFNNIFPTNERIMKIMMLDETPWDDSHHRSSFLRETFETHFNFFFSTKATDRPQHSIFVYRVDSKKKKSNNKGTIPIDISIKPKFIENYHI